MGPHTVLMWNMYVYPPCISSPYWIRTHRMDQALIWRQATWNIKAVWNVISFICLYTEATTLHGGVLMGDCWSLHFHSLMPDITRGSDSAKKSIPHWWGVKTRHWTSEWADVMSIWREKPGDRRVQGWMEIHLFICSCPYTEANNFTWWCHGVNTHRLW